VQGCTLWPKDWESHCEVDEKQQFVQIELPKKLLKPVLRIGFFFIMVTRG